jgi:hypothetical protein
MLLPSRFQTPITNNHEPMNYFTVANMESRITRPFISQLMIFLILSLLGILSASSQNKLTFSIADFHAAMDDWSANDERYLKKDGNGDKYAIIKVTSSNPQDNLSEYQFSFGNMNHIVVEHDGELWLYVQKNAKRVSISRKGYAAIPKYDLHTTIESGRNYVMILSAEDKKVLTQIAQFNIKPANVQAVVTIKNSYQDNAQEEILGTVDINGSISKSLEYGSYSYRVMAPNYHTSTGSFTLNDGKVTHIETIELQPDFSTMTLMVDANADIYINGEKKGTRQWSGVMKSGNYQVECRQANHKSSSQYIQVVENDNRTIQLIAPEPIVGTASIISNPLGATITIDDKNYGVTPKLVDILIGRHTLTLSKDGYASETKHFDVTEGKNVEISTTLGKKTKVTINTTPSAELYIDGLYMGYTPKDYVGEVGNHKVRLSSDGYCDFNKTVYIGDEKQMNFSLSRQYVKKKDYYIEAGGTVGSLTTVAAAIGVHFFNFNIEAGYNYCFSSSPNIYWNYIGDGDAQAPLTTTYKPYLILGGKIGWGIIVGTRVKFTPQIGYRFVKISDRDGYGLGSYCSSGTGGVRVYIALAKSFGISITPEYAFALSKGEGFKILSDVSSTIKNYGEGFNAKLALVLTF